MLMVLAFEQLLTKVNFDAVYLEIKQCGCGFCEGKQRKWEMGNGKW